MGNAKQQKEQIGLAAFVIFFVALNLRPAIVAVGPLLTQIGADLNWGESMLGLLGALPLLAFALFSLLVRFLTARFSTDKVLLAALAVLALGCLVRSAFDATAVWLGTVLIGASIAVGNVLAPVIVKRDFVERVSTATGAYSACVTAGSSIAGLTAAAAAEALGGWRPALALWAIPALIAAVLWWIRIRKAASRNDAALRAEAGKAASAETSSALSPDEPADTENNTAPRTSLWRKPTTWWVTLMMGLQSATFYTLSNWLPTIAATAGFSATEAGAQLFTFQALGILSGLLIPRLMYVRGNQVCAGLVASLPMVIAGLGWLLAPQASPLWSVIGGLGQGAALVVALTLITLRGATQAETVALSGIAQSIGYLLSSIGPFAFGALIEATGSLTAPLMLLIALAAAQCLAAFPAGKIPKHAEQ